MKPEDNINEEEPLISNEEERERASKLSIGISNCKTNDNTINEKNGDFMKLKKLNLNKIDSETNNTIPISSYVENKKSKKEINKSLRIIKEAINIPFITGVIAIILTCIPFIKNQVNDSDSFVSNYIIGNLLYFIL